MILALTLVAVSGIYPRLAVFNDGGECGIGAVVPWAGRLWFVTYSEHAPGGSTDKLYELDASLRLIARPESIGGTPANRMVHRESNQLFIGPYVIDASGKVRAIPYGRMYGRLTGNARHLSDPARKIYYATMEEGFYEVDVHTLEVRELFEDANKAFRRGAAPDIRGPLLPGDHGKGLYSGQGRLVYANNGDREGAKMPLDALTGALAEWDGKRWKVVRLGQFCEVTGPGGIYGNADPEKDPVWATGFDYRSVILMLLDGGKWYAYRLPKATHTYDGPHGWHTEWPRIRDVGERDLLMTMHGMFWRFPRTFSYRNSAGIVPRSTYLRMVSDFTEWNGRIVFGSDDTARREFGNAKRVKGNIPPPGRANSNLWFVEPGKLDELGPPLGRGGVWINDDVKADEPSEPYLFSGFERRMAHLAHSSPYEVTFRFEVDRHGNGEWTPLRQVKVPPEGYAYVIFAPHEKGVWLRVRTDRDCSKATVFFHYSNRDRRDAALDPMFYSLGRPQERQRYSAGWLWVKGETLLYATADALYELDADLKLQRVNDPERHQWMLKNFAPPVGYLVADEASLIYIDEDDRRWRLPKGDPELEKPGPLGPRRIAREVATERDLFNAGGTFYELPANSSGGIAKVRPIATHNRQIQDFCSYRGLLVLSGVAVHAPPSPHLVRSADGQEGLWVGAYDDLWRLGKPRGEGGPWKDSPVKAGVPSDPYLMTGFDRKRIELRQRGAPMARIRLDVDFTGHGLWREFRTFEIPEGKSVTYDFPEGFEAYWLRVTADRDCVATAWLKYE